MTQQILIDSDILVYQVAFSVETPIYVCKGGVYKRRGFAEAMSKENGFPVTKRVNIGSVFELRRNLKQCLQDLIDHVGSFNHHHFLTSSKVQGNFRGDIATIQPYKGNRTPVAKPHHYNTIRQILHKEYGAMLVHGQEADDQIAIENQKLFEEWGNYDHAIMCTIDKDLRTIPGNHFHLKSHVIDFVSEEQAKKNFCKQLLTGDPTDNIPGLARVLRIKGRIEESDKLVYSKYITKYAADTVDMNAEECYNHVKSLYQNYDLGWDVLGEIGNLLWLRRYPGQIWSQDKEKGLV